MVHPGYVVAIDQGTTTTTGILVDGSGKVVWQAYQEIDQIYPQPGWVEHDPMELLQSSLVVLEELLEETETSPTAIHALGITNQRETTIIWDRETGEPVNNAIVWQCRRTAPLCEAMIAKGLEATIRDKTGLPVRKFGGYSTISPMANGGRKLASCCLAPSTRGCCGILPTGVSTQPT